MTAWDKFSLLDYVEDVSGGQMRPVPPGWTMRNDSILQSPDEFVWLIEHEKQLSPPGTYTIAICDNPDDDLAWPTTRVATISLGDPDMIGVAVAAAVAVFVANSEVSP